MVLGAGSSSRRKAEVSGAPRTGSAGCWAVAADATSRRGQSGTRMRAPRRGELTTVESSPMPPSYVRVRDYSSRSIRRAGMSMLRPGWTILTLTLLAPAPTLLAQDAGRAAFDSASLAWDTGRYPEALSRLEKLLTGPDRDTLRRPIALLTGEFYRTAELARDGQGLVWSRDGRRLAFTAEVAEAPRTFVLRFGEAGRWAGAAPLPGRRAVFSPDGGSIAYLATAPSAELDAARSLLAATPAGAGSEGARQHQEQPAGVARVGTAAGPAGVRRPAQRPGGGGEEPRV